MCPASFINLVHELHGKYNQTKVCVAQETQTGMLNKKKSFIPHQTVHTKNTNP